MINFLGKMFAVLVTVMSIVFLGAAIAVFVSHKNWKATIDEQNARIQELQAQQDTFTTQYKLNNANLQLELASAENQIVKLERERVDLMQRNEQVDQQLSDLKQQRRDLTTSIAQTQERNSELVTKNDQLQQDIAATQEAMGTAFDQAVRATSELHDAKLKLETELERNAQLVEQAGGTE